MPKTRPSRQPTRLPLDKLCSWDVSAAPAQVPNVHPHRFRYDTARRLVESVDLPTVAAWLGHERLDTVRIYSQPDEAALERGALALEQR
jgi:integrase